MISREIDLSEDLLFTKDKEGFNSLLPSIPWKRNDSFEQISIVSSNDSVYVDYNNYLNTSYYTGTTTTSTVSTSNYYITPSSPHWRHWATTYNIPTITESDDYVSTFEYNESSDSVIETRVPMTNGYIPIDSTGLTTTITYHNTIANTTNVSSNKLKVIYKPKDPFEGIIPFKVFEEEETIESCKLPKENIPIMESSDIFRKLKSFFQSSNIFPWNREVEDDEEKQKRKIPWLRRLRSWQYKDYIDDLLKGDNDYMDYLDSTWYNPDAAARARVVDSTSFAEFSAL